MTTLLSIDPGHQHCGVAVFRGGECTYTTEMAPTGLYDWLEVGAALWGGSAMHWDVVVCEAFRLAPGKAAALIGSALGTVEVIGVLREYCRQRGVEFVLQEPAVRRPTAAILKAHGTKLRSRGQGPHAKDAEVHGWYYVMRQEDG